MEKLPKLGLPIILIIVFTFILISKSAVTIGPEKAVLFERFGDGIRTIELTARVFKLLHPGIKC